MAIRITLYLIGAIFGLLALMSIAQAIFLGLSALVPVGWAALLSALCYLVIMGFLLLLANLRWRRPRSSSSLSKYSPMFMRYFQRHPAKSLLAALIAGAVFEEWERRRR